MTNPTPLNQAAQAVMDGLWDADIDDCQSIEEIRRRQAAGALRAVADHLPSSAMYPSCDWGYGWRIGISDAKQKLLSIAAELETQ